MSVRALPDLDPSATRAAFADLFCQDDELVQAEFTALVSAAWATPPALPHTGVTAHRPQRPPAAAVAPAEDLSRGAAVGCRSAGRGGRQRSPPRAWFVPC